MNVIDHSAVESLERLASNLKEAGVTLHLSEVKGPVMDRLRQGKVLDHLVTGQTFISTEEAVEALAGTEKTIGMTKASGV